MHFSIAFSIALAANSPAPQTIRAETLYRMNLHPMAAPKPALRYLLLPELKEMTPGNPIEGYLQCLLDQDFTAQNEQLTRAALKLVDRAARMEKPDWQILTKTKTDGFSLLLPDVQKMRLLAAGLQERFRAEIAQGRFDDAIATAKTMFAMSRHLSEHPTLIADLVAVAIAYIAIGPLQEMLEQQGCPNLYWALTNLPNPLISLDKGIEGERLLFQGELSDLDDAVPLTPAQLKKVIEHIDRIRDIDPKSSKNKTQAWLEARIKDQALLASARKRLVEYGIPEVRLRKFPAEQLLLLDEKRNSEVERDEFMKLMNLPTWEAMELGDRLKLSYEKNKPLFGPLGNTLHKVRFAQARLEQRIALLRHIEAIRLHAAGHKGQLPAKLSDIAVPLPVDPFTGKPFHYSVEGTTAHLRGSPPKGYESTAVYNLHYEITIANRNP